MHTEISCATAALHTLGDVHTTVKMAETVMFMAMLRNVKVLFTPITSEQKQNGYCGFRTPLDRACSLVSLFAIDEFDVKDSPTMFCTGAAYPGATDHCLDCFFCRHCWFHSFLDRMSSSSSLSVSPPTLLFDCLLGHLELLGVCVSPSCSMITSAPTMLEGVTAESSTDPGPNAGGSLNRSKNVLKFGQAASAASVSRSASPWLYSLPVSPFFDN